MDKAYFIEARTGCTCCSSDNFITGPYISKAEAEAEMVSMHDRKALASQFASNGRYSLISASLEVLPDGRWIIGESAVFKPDDQVPHDIGHPDTITFEHSYEGVSL